MEDRRRISLGDRATTIRRPISPFGAPATAVRGWATNVRATISTRRRDRARWQDRRDQGALPVSPERLVGLGRSFAADPGRLSVQRQEHQGLVDVARDGYLWQLERTAGKINFVAGAELRRTTTSSRASTRTGRPIVDPAHKPGTDKTADVLPSLWGGKDWPPVAYSPKTRLLYIPANENLCTELRRTQRSMCPANATSASPTTSADPCRRRSLRRDAGVEFDTGKKVWTTKLPSQNWGPVLATAGDVLSPAAPTIACSAPLTRRPARSCGSIRPSRASTACLCPSRSTASSISLCSPAGAWMPPDAESAESAVPR